MNDFYIILVIFSLALAIVAIVLAVVLPRNAEPGETGSTGPTGAMPSSIVPISNGGTNNGGPLSGTKLMFSNTGGTQIIEGPSAFNPQFDSVLFRNSTGFLNFYQTLDQDLIFADTNVGTITPTSGSFNHRIGRVGNMVIMSLGSTEFNNNAITPSSIIQSTSAIPVEYRPPALVSVGLVCYNGTNTYSGYGKVLPNGRIQYGLNANSATSAVWGATNNAIFGACFSWVL
jgi:spore coat protein U-like protein